MAGLAAAGSALGPWGAVVGGGLDLAGSIFGANSAADVARQKAEEEARQNAFNNQMTLSRKSAYEKMLGTGAGIAGQGEAGFMGAATQAPTSLEQAQKDILAGSARGLQQGAGELQAQLAQGGIRGGQLTSAMNRYIGGTATQTQEALNKQKLEDEQRRQSAILAYQSQKAGQGRTAQLAAPMY